MEKSWNLVMKAASLQMDGQMDVHNPKRDIVSAHKTVIYSTNIPHPETVLMQKNPAARE